MRFVGLNVKVKDGIVTVTPMFADSKGHTTRAHVLAKSGPDPREVAAEVVRALVIRGDVQE